ncbi:DUF3667 domain-containing protein [Kordia sp. YSTF-M3]|uniref:DUF3667 domain-containing protein n=1 Tax=Kordia aestuariivivens TaxID=2759037 RepID=A0ABR7QG78_9FLAO|nr:DUF3667 domain-containing protein [Kordia aestuariivivens]MBC8757418.1 DUF3667 domain-containing protein [Kordia aestuariivivens]
MSTETKQCPNCDYPLTSYHNFCPNCGQKVDDKLSMRLLFHNTIMNYFSVDARFFRSFIPLLIRPGYLAKQYVSGKRLMYLHPAQFYLFASIVFFFLFSVATRPLQRKVDDSLKSSFGKEKAIMADVNRVKDSLSKALEMQAADMTGDDSLAVAKVKNLLDTNFENDSTATKNENSINGKIFGFNFDTKKLDSLDAIGASTDDMLKVMGYKESDGWFAKFIGKQIIKFRANSGAGILKAFMDTIPISMFFLIPIFAFLLKILYRKRGRFAHHMVFSFYYFAFMFLAASIVLISNYIVDIPDWIDFLVIASTFFYLIISLKRFYEQGYIKTFFKTCILSFIYLIFVAPVTFVMLWIISFVLY